jgi:hypothetical protein
VPWFGDPPWFGSKKMKRRGTEMGRDEEENGKKMKKIKNNKIILKI